MKIIISESQRSKIFQRLRRIGELRESIEFQNEVQDPCNFEDGEEYADFCIDQAFCFFYKDENCRDDEDDNWYGDEDENESSVNVNYLDDDDYPERDELYELLYEEYFFKLKEFWKEYSINCI